MKENTKTIEIRVPYPDDEEDPVLRVYYTLQERWLEAIALCISTMEQFEMDGATMQSMIGAIEVTWDEADSAREAFCKFTERHHARIEPGPPGDFSSKCIRCVERPPRVRGLSELCNQCVHEMLLDSAK